MKKVTTIIGAVCLMGVMTFATSCKKNDQKADMTIQVVIPQAEEETFDGERAYLNPQGVFFWSKNDQVRVYNLAENANADESTTSLFHKVGGAIDDQVAYFQGPSVGPRKALAYRLFYPYNMVYGNDEYIEEKLAQGNRQTFVVSKKQQYAYYETEQHLISLIDPAAMPMATRIENLNGPATLEHIFGFLKFAIGAMPGEEIVVDSVKLIDNDQHLTGKVTCQISNVVDGDDNGKLDVNDVWDEFFDTYHGYTPAFVTGPLKSIYDDLSWVPEPEGYAITLDCTYDHDGSGTKSGVMLNNQNGYTWFTFVVRPGACWNGFNLVMYVHNDADPANPIEVVIDRWNGNIPGTPGMAQLDDATESNYKWAMAPRKIKTFVYNQPVSANMFH